MTFDVEAARRDGRDPQLQAACDEIVRLRREVEEWRDLVGAYQRAYVWPGTELAAKPQPNLSPAHRVVRWLHDYRRGG